MSAITMIGYPTESYAYGSIILLYSVSAAIPVLVACVYYIPLIHRLRLSSIYEVTRACRALYLLFEASLLFAETLQFTLL